MVYGVRKELSDKGKNPLLRLENISFSFSGNNKCKGQKELINNISYVFISTT